MSPAAEMTAAGAVDTPAKTRPAAAIPAARRRRVLSMTTTFLGAAGPDAVLDLPDHPTVAQGTRTVPGPDDVRLTAPQTRTESRETAMCHPAFMLGGGMGARVVACVTALLVVPGVARAAEAPPLELVKTQQLDPRLIQLTLRTPALKAETHVRLLLPDGYETSSRRYPVPYLLPR